MKSDMIPQEFVWTDQAIDDFWNYASNSVLMRNSFSKMWSPDLAKIILKLIPRGSTICDFGAGSGDMIVELLKYGYKVGAYEPSEERRSAFPIQVVENKNFLGFRTDLKYDCVICFEVLEHLTDIALPNVLKKINKLLKDDGLFIGSTPWDEDLKNNYCLCPSCHILFHRWQHMRSFNKESIKKLLFDYKFIPLEMFRAPFVNSLIFLARKEEWQATHQHLQENSPLTALISRPNEKHTVS